MIKQYLDEMEKVRPLGKTKEATLNAIAASEFGQTVDSDINSQRLVDFALWRMRAVASSRRLLVMISRISALSFRLHGRLGGMRSISMRWRTLGKC
ncbi:hypothetical protein D3C84_800770 [compost metagenome]